MSVIFANESVDLRNIYEWGIKRGNGTPEARDYLRRRLENMAELDEEGQRAHLSISSQHRLYMQKGMQEPIMSSSSSRNSLLTWSSGYSKAAKVSKARGGSVLI